MCRQESLAACLQNKHGAGPLPVRVDVNKAELQTRTMHILQLRGNELINTGLRPIKAHKDIH